MKLEEFVEFYHLDFFELSSLFSSVGWAGKGAAKTVADLLNLLSFLSYILRRASNCTLFLV